MKVTKKIIKKRIKEDIEQVLESHGGSIEDSINFTRGCIFGFNSVLDYDNNSGFSYAGAYNWEQVLKSLEKMLKKEDKHKESLTK